MSGSAFLVENNVIDNVIGPLLSSVSMSGGVFGYNYIPKTATPNGWLYAAIEPHFSHTYANLFEGNMGPSINLDNIWGSGSHQTIFRNRFTGGYDPIYNNNRYPVVIQAQQRYTTMVGNVLGWPGFQKNYEFASTSVITADDAVYTIGFWGATWTDPSRTQYDNKVYTTLLRHGNYDFANNTTIWDPNISSRTFPASLYAATKPAWFGVLSWPAIGPDISLAGEIPAKYCYERKMMPNCLVAPTEPPAPPQPPTDPDPQPEPTEEPPANPNPVNSDSEAPSVSITRPKNGDTFGGGKISITAQAADNVRVAGVTFYANGIQIAPEDIYWPYSASWKPPAVGTYTITAKARDTANNMGISLPVKIIVQKGK